MITNKQWKEIFERKDNGEQGKVLAKDYDTTTYNISRKYAQHVKTRELLKGVLPEKELERLAVKEAKAILEQKKAVILKSESHKILRQAASIDEALANIQIKPIRFTKLKKDAEWLNLSKEKVIAISDLHYINKNESQSLFKLPQEVLNQVNKGDDITLLLAGDYIENKLHAQQIETEGTAMQQATEVSHILIDIIGNIANVANSLKIYMVAGNHDRVQRNKQKEVRKDSYAYMICSMIKLALPDVYINYSPDRVAFMMPDGEGAILTHGHIGIRNSDKLDEWLTKHNAQTNQNLKWIFAGHYHKQTFIQNKGSRQNVILIPSAKGEYERNDFEIDNNLRSITGFNVISFEGNSVIYKFIKR